MLLEAGLLEKEELEHALAVQKETGRLLGAILVERGYVSGPALAVALASQYGVELKTERGFGTGLWAEIDRRHRAGRGRGAEDNVVRLEAKPAMLEAVPDPEPALEELRIENLRLREEIERLRAELTRPRVVKQPEKPTSHVLFVPSATRYVLVERDGLPPAIGEELELGEFAARFVVMKIGRAPLPGERRPCAFLVESG